MSGLSQEDIDFAVNAAMAGRSLEFIASVLGVRPKKAQSIINVHGDQKRRFTVDMEAKSVWHAGSNEIARAKAEALFAHNDAEGEIETPSADRATRKWLSLFLLKTGAIDASFCLRAALPNIGT